MASDNFWYQPTTGTGNTMVSVSAETTNMTGTVDKIATIALTAGNATKNVTVKQRYKPVAQQFASTTFPATGGTIYFTIHSEYDVVFRSVPDWITISYNGTVYSEGQRIASGAVDNKTFSLTADPNTGASRTVANTFNMGHFIGDTLQQYVSYFSFTQLAGTVNKNMVLSPTGATVVSSRTSYTIYVPTTSCTFCGMTYTNSNQSFPVTAVKDGYYIRLAFTANTGSERSTTITFTLRDEENYPYVRTFNLTQEEAISTGWYIANNTGLDLYGNIFTTSQDLSVEIMAGEEEEYTESTPIYITGFAIVASPMPSLPENIDIALHNPNTGDRIYGDYNGSAWVGSGDLSVDEGESLSLDRT